MSEPTYYQPTIEEFHVGFEYEWRDLSREDMSAWKKLVISSLSDLTDTVFYEEERIEAYGTGGAITEEIRVKHLDREDIEACGWTQKHYDVFSLGDVELELNEEGLVYIYDSGGRLFKGTIRNRSELIKVMQMIGVK